MLHAPLCLYGVELRAEEGHTISASLWGKGGQNFAKVKFCVTFAWQMGRNGVGV